TLMRVGAECICRELRSGKGPAGRRGRGSSPLFHRVFSSSRGRPRMRILLTGAGGQVGTDLIPLLLSQGHEVTGFDLAEAPAAKFGLDFRGVRFPGLISLIEPGGGTSDYVNWMYFDGVRKGAYEAFVTPETRIPLMYMPDALRALAELAAAPRGRLKRSIYNI